MKKLALVFSMLALMMCMLFGTTVGSASAATSEDSTSIPLYIENETITTTNESITFSADLMLDSDSKAIVLSGTFYTTIYIAEDNRIGEIWWTVTLNSDFIKSVTGTVIVKRDWFGPVNPVLCTRSVKFYEYQTFFSSARDIVEYDLGKSYKDSDNLIFQFTDFHVQGVYNDYTVGYREVQKEIRDLERF